MMEIKIKKLHPDAVIPKYATIGSACFDLCAFMPGKSVSFFESFIFETALAFEIPRGYAMMIYSRSGHGFNNNIRLSNCVGVIDSDYVGQVKIKLTCDDEYADFIVRHGDRIAQAMIIPVPDVNFIEVNELTETERGTSGFGSTGVN